jgi:two-component system, OmpR family, response regulator MprA
MTHSVLVVDDDPAIRLVIETLLAEEGFDVRGAADGIEALRALHESVPDVVILDLLMPRMNGREFLEQVHREGEHPSVLILSATDAHKTGDEFGVRALSKPFDIDDLVAEVESLMETPQRM